MNRVSIRLLMLVIPFAFCSVVSSAVPETISYQGYLTDASGNPVNGTVSMTFKIYTNSTSTFSLWSQTTSTVNVTNGVYSVALGTPPTPFNLPFDAQYWLGVTVGADQEMTPRTRFRAAPYSVRAVTAESAENLVSQTSTSHVVNLNADMVDGQHAASLAPLVHLHADTDLTGIMPLAKGGTGSSTKNFVDLSGDQTIGGTKTFSNTLVSTAVTGSAPFQVASTTMVANLNAEMVGGQTVAALDARYDAKYSQGLIPARIISTTSCRYGVGHPFSMTLGLNGPLFAKAGIGSLELEVCGDPVCSEGSVLSQNVIEYVAYYLQYISLALGADGRPVIAYYDADNYDLKVAKCGDAVCATGNTITTVDTTGDVGQHISLAIGTGGTPVIAYYDATNRDLKVVKCGNAACSTGNSITTVVSVGDAGQYASLAIGTDGTPVIAYYDAAYHDLRVVKCGNASCSTGNTIGIVDTGYDFGQYASLAIGTDGTPVIAYYDAVNRYLKVAKCGNASCSTGNTRTTVDTTTSDVGQYSSLAIGTDGMPVIAYYDAANRDLRAVKCGNASCSAGNTIIVVDSEGDAGQYASIMIGADGNPFIVYENQTVCSNVARLITRRGR